MKDVKNKKQSLFGIFAILFATVLSVISFASCEVGLGSAVDTQPPSIEIKNPPVDAVIRDNFALAGTYSDDGTIKSVSAALKRVDVTTNEFYEFKDFQLTYDEVVKGAGTWSIPIEAISEDTKTKLIPDGTYQAVITIKDKSDRTTVQNTTFTIDNTAPVIVLQRPATDSSVTDENDIDTFGTIFTLEGQAADDNNIDHIDINIYADAAKTQFIHPVTLRNVPLSIALDVAKFGDDDYTKIYGSDTEGGAKIRYFTIEAFDSAQRYPADGSEQSEEDKKGNCADGYYLYNDVKQSSILASLKITELYHMMNGNLSSDRSAVSLNVVRETLESLKKSSGSFILNPLNNPKFKVSGWKKADPADPDDEGFVAFENSPITIDIDPGLDGYPLYKDSLRVYLLKLNDDGSLAQNATKIYPNEQTKSGASSYKITFTVDRNNAENSAGETIKYSYGNYLIGVEGEDSEHHSILPEYYPENEVGYPINIKSASEPPELTIEYDVNGTNSTSSIIYLPKYKSGTSNQSVITLSGTVKLSSGDISNLNEFSVSVDGTAISNIDKTILQVTATEGIYSFEGVQVKFDLSSPSKQHTISVFADAGAKSTEKKTVMYDAEGPVVEIRSVSPIASKYNADGTVASTNYLNGKNVSIAVSFTDAFDVVDTTTNKPKIEFVQGDNVVTILDDINVLSCTVTNVDTTGLTDGDVTIRVTAYDRSGNETVEEVPFEIDQTTDNPVILSGDDNLVLNYSYNQIKDKSGTRNNVYNVGGQLLLHLIDDDGLKNITVYTKKITTADGSDAKPSDGTPANLSGKDTTFSFTLPTDADFYKIWIDVTDNTTPAKTKTLAPFFVQVANGVPVVSLENNQYVTTLSAESDVVSSASKSPLAVKITIDSTEGPFVVKRALVTSENPNPSFEDASLIQAADTTTISSVPAASGSSKTVTDYYPITNAQEGSYTLKYFVQDSNGNTGVKTTTYKYDKTKPTIGTPKFGTEAIQTNHWYDSDTYKLVVAVNDDDLVQNAGSSGVQTVEYKINSETEWTALSKSTDGYQRTITFANGDNTLYIRAIDNVGNKSETTKTFTIDTTAPDFTVEKNSSGSTGNYIYINKTTSTQPLVLYGQYKDEQSGVGALTISLGSTNAAVKYYSGDSTDINSVSDSSYAAYTAANAKTIKFWRAEFTKANLDTIFATDKSKSLTVSGSNVAGKPIANTPNLTIMMDKDDPYFENINLKGSDSKGVYKKSETQYYASTKIDATHNRTFTLTGIAKDDTSGIAKVTCKVGSAAAVETQDSGWTFPVTLGADGSSITVVLTAYDKAGNYVGQDTITITTDNTAPEGIHKVDAKQKNAAFRIGNNNNDDITSTTASSFKTNNVALTWDSYTPADATAPVTGIDTDVGKKYSSDTYGNAETVKVRGYFKEDGSGISLIYYKVFDVQPTTSNHLAQDFLADYEAQADGYFATTSPVTKRVFYNKDNTHTFDGSLEATNGTKTLNYIYQDYNFYTTISGLVNSNNYIVLVAVDNVGNAALDSAKVNGEDYYDYQLNVDNDVPSVEAGDDFQEIINPALNPDSTITVYGTASDAAAGIRSLVAKVNGTVVDSENITYTIIKEGAVAQANGKYNIYPTKTSGNTVVADTSKTPLVADINVKYKDNIYTKNYVWWKAEIKRSAFTGIDNGKSASVQITATDDAGTGNSETFSVANVIIDNVAPTIILTDPVDADSEVSGIQINGIISLSGTVSDSNVLPATVITGLEYKKDTGNWTAASNITSSGNYTFTIANFDTTGLADGDYKLRAKGVDKSGNEGTSNEVTVKISKDSDRPKLNITNLAYSESLSTYLLRYGTNAQVTGTVTDDDSTTTAVISKLYITETEYTGAAGQTTPTNLVNASGEFTFEPSNTGDGTKTFYIYMEDNKGGKFYSTATGANNNPKLYLKGTALGSSANSSSFSYISDSLSPSVQLGKGLPYSYSSETSAYTIAKDSTNVDFDKEKDNSNLNSSFVIGGSARKFVKFYFTGNDASGIAGMSLEIKDSTDAQAVVKRLTTAASIAGTTFATTGTDPYTVDTGTFSGTQDASTDASWTTDYIDVSSWTTGQITAYITVYDRVGNSATGSYSFSVDNTAPEIKVSSPASGEEKTGTISIVGQTNDTGSAGAANIQWIIPTTTEVTTADGKTGTAKLEYLKGLSWLGGKDKLSGETTVSSWQFDFDGTTNASLESYDSATYASTPAGGVYTLPVYFMATDALGNYTIKQDFIIRHNPDGDKPKVTFTYPTTESYDNGKDYVTLGGTIVPTGTAEIPSNTTSVRSVYLQIADSSGNFNTTDKNKASGTYGLTVVDAYAVINAIKGTTYTSSTTFTDAELKEFGFATKDELDAWWGIEVTGTASWRMQLNSDGKLNPTVQNTTNNIKIRACGVNANGKMGAWTQGDNVLSIHVDLNVPTISAVVNQYATDVNSENVESITETASQSYTADMFIKGQWYLVLDILDESDISAVEVSGKVGETTADVPHVDKNITATVNGKTKSGKRTFVKINKDVTAITYTIAATEGGDPGSAKTTRASFSFKLDNTAPSLDDIKDTGDTALSQSGVNKVQNSNYIYTLKGESDDYEGGSGVEQVVFYYMRKSGVTATTISNEVVLDPMIKPSGSTYSTLPLTGNGALTAISIEGTTEKLYGKSITGTISANANGQFNTFTAGNNFDEHVRVGGLIKVSGLFRKITSKTGSVVTFTPPATSGGSSTALFPIAQVIDASNTAKKNSDNPFQFDSGKDDGDGMVESFSKSGSKWTWDASIHSDNLPDGPATLVILAFDNAGNVSGKSYKMMVSNNAPRIAKVFLATDLNRDGSYAESEFETYNIAAASGNTNGVELYSLTTANFTKYVKNAKDEWEANASTRKAFTIKNGLAILPEILGGNGAIGLVFNKNDTTTAEDGKQTGTGSAKSGTLSGTNISGDYWSFASSEFTSDSAAQKMSFTFWDSTNECTQGTNSQYAFLRVNDFVIDQIDGVAPNVVVNPFYWNSATDNSLYGNSTANGHIELEGDLTSAVTTLYGNDPKVSGKIVVRGTAYDDTYIKSLSFSMSNFGTSTTTPIVLAEFNGSAWVNKKTNSMATNNYEVTVTNDYFNQDGHKVNWEVAIDPSKVTHTANLNSDFTVIVNDLGDNKSTEDSKRAQTGSIDATTHNPTYTMDIVPYITKLYTSISDTAGEEFARSATGKYIVRASENIRMYGFNLKAGNGAIKVSYDSGNPTSITPTNPTDAEITSYGSHLKLPIGATAKSGKVSITVNSIQSLNNLNANPTFTSETDDTITAYQNNSQANGITNNRLNDDVELWVWDFGAFLSNTDITSPMMKMDKNSNYYMSYGFGVPSMYVNKNGRERQVDFSYNKFHNTNVIFDDNGNIYAVATATDRVVNDSSRFVLYTPHDDFMPDYVDSSNKHAYQYKSTSKRHLEMAYNKDTSVYNINRVKRPKLASYTNGATTYLSVVYFDYNNNDSPVRFRFGKKTNGTPSYAQQGNTNYAFTYDTTRSCFTSESISQNYDGYYVKIGSDYYKLTIRNNNNNTRYYLNDYNSTEGFSSYIYKKSVTDATLSGGIMNNITADGQQTDNPTYASSATEYHTIADKNTSKKGGEYAAVGIVPSTEGTNGYVADVAGYHARVRKVYYSYNTNPDTVSDTVWQTNAKELDGNAYTGWYVDLAVDDDGGIHIAYYNSAKGDLKYVHLDSYDATPSAPVTVDSYLSVGTNITVNVRKEGGNNIPYIYYYNASSNQTPNSIKVAWRNDITSLRDGAINDKFTGAWESMTIPTTNIPVDATVCGGVPTGGDYSGTVVLGYMTDVYYERANIKK